MLTDEALRRVSGFDDTDAPEQPVDLATSTVLRMIEANPNLMTNPGTDALVNEIRALVKGTPSTEVPEPATTDTTTTGGFEMPGTSDEPADIP